MAMKLAEARNLTAVFGFACATLLLTATVDKPADAASLEPEAIPGSWTASRAVGPAAQSDVLIEGAAARARQAAPLVDLDDDGLSDGLEAMLAELAPQEPVDVVVTLSRPGTAAETQAAVGAFAVKREYHLIDGFAATMTAGQARALASAPGVFRVEEDFQVRVLMEWARTAFGVEALRAESNGYDGTGIKTCVVDTGIQASHEQFVDESAGSRVWGFVDLVGDYTGTIRAEPYDDFHVGHGTHVSGILAGDGAAGEGGDLDNAPRARGVAPAAEIYVAKALDYTGMGPESDIIAGIEWCVDRGVDVVNLSVGSDAGSRGKDALSKAAENAVKAGVVVVAATGNSGDIPGIIASPAAADAVIAVGAGAEWTDGTCPSDLPPTICSEGFYAAPFTSRGPTDDGRIKPDIMAPGVTILSASNNEWVYADPYFGLIFGSNECGISCYRELSGTSMATPFVSGTVALMLDAAPGLTPAEVAAILRDTARHRGLGTAKNNLYGHGLIDVYAAVKAAAGESALETATGFPSDLAGSYLVDSTLGTAIPIEVDDTGMPLAVTVTIDGKPYCGLRFGNVCYGYAWDPDIDARLLNSVGQEVFFSGCPAYGDCGVAGHQETLYLAPPAGGFLEVGYTLELFLWEEDPNYGSGESFPVTVAISNGTATLPLTALAGPDQEVREDGSGFATVTLDGSGSTGPIASHEWRLAQDETVLCESESDGPPGTCDVTLAVGSHTVRLTVFDQTGSFDSDAVAVKVTEAKGGGGGGGPSGDKCFKNKEPRC